MIDRDEKDYTFFL